MDLKKKLLVSSLAFTLSLSAQNAFAFKFDDLLNGLGSSQEQSEQIPPRAQKGAQINHQTQIVIGFSPEGSAQKAIINAIRSAKSELRLAAYSFTSRDIVKELVAAKKRGIDVKIVVDEKGNKSKHSISAMNTVRLAKIPIRTNGRYAIMHDKFIVVDRQTVETGSFNYSDSANKRNSENAIVLYNLPEVAEVYLEHWECRWAGGTEPEMSY
ncbi:phospholipase D family protein [Providencia rettgeri]